MKKSATAWSELFNIYVVLSSTMFIYLLFVKYRNVLIEDV